MRLPQELASAIERETDGVDAKALARAAEALSRAYQTGEAQGAIDSAAARAAYLITRLPATFAAASFVMQELARRVQSLEIRSVLDLGAGVGPASWATCAALASVREVALVEGNAELVATGKRLAKTAGVDAMNSAEWICGDLASYEPGRDYDLATAGYALGELTAGARERLLARMWARVRAFAVIEPGTPRGFANILSVRSFLIANGAYVATPCPHERECPVRGTKDWCHFAARLERSSLHRRLKAGELGYEDEKFSYVVAAKERPQQAAARIVRHPLHLKGHTRLDLCTPEGLKQLTITRSEGEAYKRAKRSKWGEEWRS